MKNIDILKYGLSKLTENGAQKAQCEGEFSTGWELTALAGKIELLRTLNDEVAISMKGWFDGKVGGNIISSADTAVIDETAKACLENSKGGKADDTPVFNENPVVQVFGQSAPVPDLEKMISRTNEFLDETARLYPNVLIRQMILIYRAMEHVYVNSAGVELTEYEGSYDCSIMFSGFNGDDNSSFNTYGFSFKDLDAPIMDRALISKRLEEAQSMVYPVKNPDKVVGTMLVTPHCLDDFLRQLMNAYASSGALISMGSKWQNAIGTQVACESFNLASKPLCGKMAHNSHFTSDGFVCENQTIIENGVLKSLFADHYTAAKTNLPQRLCEGGHFVIPQGDKSLDDIIKSIDKGIIINRFSGGHVNASGELAGIAKNSFYIENGKIGEASKETMISGNLSDMLMNIGAISIETVSDGTSTLPYVAFNNITIF